jgi:hypothetical protein
VDADKGFSRQAAKGAKGERKRGTLDRMDGILWGVALGKAFVSGKMLEKLECEGRIKDVIEEVASRGESKLGPRGRLPLPEGSVLGVRG